MRAGEGKKGRRRVKYKAKKKHRNARLGRGKLGERIRTLRLARNFSQQAVAGDLGIAHTTLSSWERGERAMSVDTLFTLAEYFGVAPGVLLGEVADPTFPKPGEITRKRARPVH